MLWAFVSKALPRGSPRESNTDGVGEGTSHRRDPGIPLPFEQDMGNHTGVLGHSPAKSCLCHLPTLGGGAMSLWYLTHQGRTVCSQLCLPGQRGAWHTGYSGCRGRVCNEHYLVMNTQLEDGAYRWLTYERRDFRLFLCKHHLRSVDNLSRMF